MLVATSHWLYMTLRRLGQDAEAQRLLEPIHPDLEILENHEYHQLLLMYSGLTSPLAVWNEEGDSLGSATSGYGVGNWYQYEGRKKRAREIFEQVLQGGQWTAFGYIAAEAELARDADDC
jgi:hypothetical protein